jgi:hypothetical protein
MPNSVEEVRFSSDFVRLKEGVSAPLLKVLASRWVRSVDSPTGGVTFSFGGVALVMLTSKGLRGVGRIMVGPSEGMLRWFLWERC